MKGPRLRTIATRQDGHRPPLVLERAGELLDDRRLAGAAHRQVSDGNDLHSERRVAQDADVVKKPAELDENFENLREGVKQGPDELRPRSATLVENDLQQEGFPIFPPHTKLLSH